MQLNPCYLDNVSCMNETLTDKIWVGNEISYEKYRRNKKNTYSREMEIIVDINSDHAMGSNYFQWGLFVYFDMCIFNFIHGNETKKQLEKKNNFFL